MGPRIDVVTAFPDMFGPVFGESVMGRSVASGLLDIRVHDLRDYSSDRRRTLDDYSFGGGCGMVMMAEPIHACVEKLLLEVMAPTTRVILTSPQGRPFDQAMASEFASQDHLIILCGHYEGIDERVADLLVTDEVSIGDFVMTGGEIAAMAMVDAVSRHVPGVVGKEESVSGDSFYSEKVFDCPHFTRPADWRGFRVPEVLLGGHHKFIQDTRRRWALSKTARVRPDLVSWKEVSTVFAEKIRKKRGRGRGRPPGVRRGAKRCGFHLALVHYPVLNKLGDVVATALTNFDIHDISRSSRTFGASAYHLILPQASQRDMAAKLLGFWRDDASRISHINRKDALSLARVWPTLNTCIQEIEFCEGERPLIVVTSARPAGDRQVSYSDLREIMDSGGHPVLLVFGTGYGLAEEVMESADMVLPPILGAGDWNHLSVRAAVAIILDRLRGN
jgi:tRNA (guanine37-N1)-methyltransferase